MQCTHIHTEYPPRVGFSSSRFRLRIISPFNKGIRTMANTIETTYYGRVSSKGNGVFYSPQQTLGSFSILPNDDDESLRPIYKADDKPSEFVQSYPRLQVTTDEFGTIESLERDVVCLDSEGHITPLSEVS